MNEANRVVPEDCFGAVAGDCVEEFEVWEDESCWFGDAVNCKENYRCWEEGYDVFDANNCKGVGFHTI